MRVAILGGTFNPPHFGHLFFANEVRQQLNYDKIVFVPSSISAHKDMDMGITASNRLDMITLAVKDYKWADVSNCDILRGGVTRTVDTIDDIINEYHLECKPGFIIGDDLVAGFHKWKNPELLAQKADLILGVRDGVKADFIYPHLIANNRHFPLSSSEIRERVLKGLDIDFLLPSNVIRYIKKNDLYREIR